jgi:hypothetical protein
MSGQLSSSMMSRAVYQRTYLTFEGSLGRTLSLSRRKHTHVSMLVHVLRMAVH